METVAGVLLVVGAALTSLAGIGVLRLPDLYSRMHAATKASTLGIGLVGLGAVLLVDGAVAKVVVTVVLIGVTAPSAAHVIGRAAYGAEGIDLRLDGPDDLQDLVVDGSAAAGQAEGSGARSTEAVPADDLPADDLPADDLPATGRSTEASPRDAGSVDGGAATGGPSPT